MTRTYLYVFVVLLSISTCDVVKAENQAALSGAAQANAIADAVVEQLVQYSDLHWHKGEYCHIVNLDKMIVTAQPDNVDAYGNAGWLLWSMNRDAEAIALYDQGLKANPKSYYMFDELGFYYYNRKKDFAKAVKYLEQAAARDDVKPATLHLLAHSYEKTGNLKLSLKTWERAKKIPGDMAAKTNYERVKRKMN